MTTYREFTISETVTLHIRGSVLTRPKFTFARIVKIAFKAPSSSDRIKKATSRSPPSGFLVYFIIIFVPLSDSVPVNLASLIGNALRDQLSGPQRGRHSNKTTLDLQMQMYGKHELYTLVPENEFPL